MTLNELNVPNKFGTMPIFQSTSGSIIYNEEGIWKIEQHAGTRILAGEEVVTFDSLTGYYIYHVERTYLKFSILFLLPATPENLLIIQALGKQ